MKIIYLGIILFIFVSCIQAQNAGDASGAPDLVIVQKEWRIEFRNPALDEDPFRANNELRQAQIDRRENERRNAVRSKLGQPLEAPPTRASRVEGRRADPWTRYIYQLKIKNTGEKEIKTLTWDYVFFEPGTQNEVGRQRFISKANVSANKTKNLVFRSSAPPTQTINAANAGTKPRDQYSEKIVILAIEYEDGSIWKAVPSGN